MPHLHVVVQTKRRVDLFYPCSIKLQERCCLRCDFFFVNMFFTLLLFFPSFICHILSGIILNTSYAVIMSHLEICKQVSVKLVTSEYKWRHLAGSLPRRRESGSKAAQRTFTAGWRYFTGER